MKRSRLVMRRSWPAGSRAPAPRTRARRARSRRRRARGSSRPCASSVPICSAKNSPGVSGGSITPPGAALAARRTPRRRARACARGARRRRGSSPSSSGPLKPSSRQRRAKIHHSSRRSPRGRDDARRVLHVRPRLQAEPGVGEVGALELVGRRQQIVRELAGDVAVEVDRRRADRATRAPRAAAARPPSTSSGLPASTNSARTWPGPGVRISSASRLPGSEPRTWRMRPKRQSKKVRAGSARPERAARRVVADRLDVAAAPVEVAGHEREHVHEPVGEGALAAHVDAGRHRDRRAVGRLPIARDLADRRRRRRRSRARRARRDTAR